MGQGLPLYNFKKGWMPHGDYSLGESLPGEYLRPWTAADNPYRQIPTLVNANVSFHPGFLPNLPKLG
jgi:hypothetical protein